MSQAALCDDGHLGDFYFGSDVSEHNNQLKLAETRQKIMSEYYATERFFFDEKNSRSQWQESCQPVLEAFCTATSELFRLQYYEWPLEGESSHQNVAP